MIFRADIIVPLILCDTSMLVEGFGLNRTGEEEKGRISLFYFLILIIPRITLVPSIYSGPLS